MYHANIVYTSRAVVDVNPSMVSGLADQSARRNALQDITGVLICGGGRFLQVLEGDRSKLTALYAKIANDPRHSDCNILLEQSDVKRRFPAFHMGHLSLGVPSRSDQQAWEQLCENANGSFDLLSRNSDPVVSLIREFMNRFGNTRRHPAFSA